MIWIRERRHYVAPSPQSGRKGEPGDRRSPQSPLRGEPILEDLKYLGWQTDRDNYNSTPLMLWIHYR